MYMINLPWNKFCLIWVLWHLPYGFSIEVWVTIQTRIKAEKGPPTQKLKNISVPYIDYRAKYSVLNPLFFIVFLVENYLFPEPLPTRPGRYTENHNPNVNISSFLDKNQTEKKID